MRALLDINVLLALFDSGHQFHARAREWLSLHIDNGWASCPITQNGFIRVMGQPSYPNRLAPKQAIARLAEATQSAYHAFWPDDVTILDETRFDGTRIHGAKQLTDVYLLGLACRHEGCFVTFDGGVPIAAVHGATADRLVVL